MLDRDLAELYGVPVKRLNEQVRRNPSRFPDGFMYQLSAAEFADLKSQIATSSSDGALGHKISDADAKTFNSQYAKLSVRYSESFHDRFLIVDDKELYLIGASLKDLGRKCFAFTKLDPGEIRRVGADKNGYWDVLNR